MQDRFTLYDVFAVLVPGVIFMYLLAFTLDQAVGVQLFDWQGSIGDAALLFVFGYAAGALLQALGNAVIEKPWRWLRGGQPTATLLTSKSNKLSASTKSDVLGAIEGTYGESTLREKDKGYLKFLEDRTYRAWKTVAPSDPQAQRFLAEVHAVRAFAMAFLLLLAVTIAGTAIYGEGGMNLRTHGTLAGLYALLFLASLWRMENKAVTFARHALIAFVERVSEKKEKNESS